MTVFIDASGKYYKAATPKDSGDAKIEFPTKQMLEYLTDTPVTIPEFGVGVRQKEIAKSKSVTGTFVEDSDEL